MARKRKPKDYIATNQNAKLVLAVREWQISVFNAGSHLRINGVVDVWPTRRRWMPTVHAPGRYAEVYRDLDHLRTIVTTQVELNLTKEARNSKWLASLPEGNAAREPVKPIESWEEFGRRFDGPMPTKQDALFDAGPTQKNAAPMKPLNPYAPDPNSEHPPW